MGSGLCMALTDRRLLVPHEEVDIAPERPEGAYRVIRPEQVLFISYPYEWCFTQLKQAALTTLEIQKTAPDFGTSLKDASAYNIQLLGGKPVFIDTLSFAAYREGLPIASSASISLHPWPSEFSMILYQTTLFYPIGLRIGVLDSDLEQWKRVQYKFDKLEEIPANKKPTFVFAHMLVPHSPYVFDRDGNFVTQARRDTRTESENYVEQLIYTNKRITQLVDAVLATSDVPPIIVLQSDEGPFPLRYGQDVHSFDWTQATEPELR